MLWAEAGEATVPFPRRIIFSEDFESDGRMQVWANNGDFQVNFAGPTDERAVSGKRSFKIDIIWRKGTYNYWRWQTMMIPFCGEPKLRASLCVVRGKAELAYWWNDPRAQLTGQVERGKETGRSGDQWSQWEASATGRPEDGQHVVSVVICLRPDQEGRSVVYVDDLEVEAAVGPDYENETKARIAQIPARRKAQAESLRRRLDDLERRTDALPAALPASVSPLLQEFWIKGKAEIRQMEATLDALITALQTSATDEKIATVDELQTSAEVVYGAVTSFAEQATSCPQSPWLVWIVDPMSNARILPDKFPVAGRPGTQLRVTACRGEYEPASFAVYAPKDKGLRAVLATPSAAGCGERTIPASDIDVRVVKCWWQAGTKINDIKHPTFVPELLLKDAGFVSVDNAKKRNVLRDPKTPRDAKQLVPLAVPAGAMQQFWVTVHVPDDTEPGVYRGTIALSAADVPPASVAMEIEVLPFALLEPRLQYSIYYRGCLTGHGKGSIDSESKSSSQYLAEMRNLKAHGVDRPMCYQHPGRLLEQAIELRKEAGLVVDPLYYLGGLGVQATDDAAELTALTERTKALAAEVARYGIKDLYLYGIDEAHADVLEKERKAFRAVHEGGARLHVACAPIDETGDAIGDLLDLAIFGGPLAPEQAAKWHARGKRVFSYSNPQVGVEEPETYRRNFGLALWKAGYDGACDYAYQHGFGDIWDDFDDKEYRDHVFAYPTVDGVIDTTEWEGFREGVDDVRYLATLLDAIERAKTDPARKQRAADAERWVQTLDVQGDLNALRTQMIQWIGSLRK